MAENNVTSPIVVSLGDSYIDCRLSPKTKKIYESKIKQFTLWIKWRHPFLFCADRARVKYELLTSAILIEFIGDVSLKRNRKAETAEVPFVFVVPHKKQSYEHVSGYKSAIVNEFKTHGIPISGAITTMFAQIFAGYKRTVGEMKLNGEMPMQEGKQPITFDGVKFLAKESMCGLYDVKTEDGIYVMTLNA